MTTEIQPLETRSASQSVSVVNFTFWQFVITQTYLSMLCTLQWGVFVFFGGVMNTGACHFVLDIQSLTERVALTLDETLLTLT